MLLCYVIKKPLITEKNSKMGEGSDKTYVFEVALEATKIEVKRAVEKYFRVNVDLVRTSVCRGRSKKTKVGQSAVPYWKKAMIKLKSGESISLFEGA